MINAYAKYIIILLKTIYPIDLIDYYIFVCLFDRYINLIISQTLKKILITITFLLVITFSCLAQKTYHHSVLCGRIILADTINSKIRWELYLQKRTQDAGSSNPFAAPHFFSVWPWLNYSFSKATRVSLSPIGYFDSHLFYNNLDEVKSQGVKEYRISLRVENEQKLKLFNYANRYGLEYRMRDLKYDGNYLANWRARYMLKVEKPLFNIVSKDKPLSLFLSNEVFIQFGEAVKDNPNVFDQDRINVGVSYEVVKNVKVTASYLKILQSRISGREFDDANALWVILTFDNLFSQLRNDNK